MARNRFTAVARCLLNGPENGEGVRVQRTGSTAMGRLGTIGAPICTVFYTVIHGL